MAPGTASVTCAGPAPSSSSTALTIGRASRAARATWRSSPCARGAASAAAPCSCWATSWTWSSTGIGRGARLSSHGGGELTDFPPHPSSWDAEPKSEFFWWFFPPLLVFATSSHISGVPAPCLGDDVFILSPSVFSAGCFSAAWRGSVAIPRLEPAPAPRSPLAVPFPWSPVSPRPRCQDWMSPLCFSGLLCRSRATPSVGPTGPGVTRLA